jgi:hypothetical protein
MPNLTNVENPEDIKRLKEETEVQQRLASVSCWTLNDNVSDKMFSLMEVNGGIRREVAIRTTISRVCTALDWVDGSDAGHWGLRGPVLYVDSLDFDVLQTQYIRSFFWKHSTWKVENEYRFVFQTQRAFDMWKDEVRLQNDPHFSERVRNEPDFSERVLMQKLVNPWYGRKPQLQDVHWMKCELRTLIEAVFIRANSRAEVLGRIVHICEVHRIPWVQLTS